MPNNVLDSVYCSVVCLCDACLVQHDATETHTHTHTRGSKDTLPQPMSRRAETSWRNMWFSCHTGEDIFKLYSCKLSKLKFVLCIAKLFLMPLTNEAHFCSPSYSLSACHSVIPTDTLPVIYHLTPLHPDTSSCFLLLCILADWMCQEVLEKCVCG